MERALFLMAWVGLELSSLYVEGSARCFSILLM